MWTLYRPVPDFTDDQVAFLRVYAGWPSWRRWAWRTLGR